MEDEEYGEYRQTLRRDNDEEGRWSLYLQIISLPSQLLGGITAVVFVVLVFTKGIKWYWEILFPLVGMVISVPILLTFPFGLVFSIFRKLRGLGGILLVISSLLYLFVIWSQALAFAYFYAGRFWMLIGFFLAGVGVFFMAIVGAIIQGEYADAITVVISLGIFFLVYYGGAWMVFSADEREKLAEDGL